MIREGLTSVRQSKTFVAFVAVVLELGNYMNGGHAQRGQVRVVYPLYWISVFSNLSPTECERVFC